MSVENLRYELLDCKRTYVAEAQRYTRPIVQRTWDSPWEMFDSHAYPGGALRLHMLRWKLSEPLFWNGVQSYVKKFKGCVVETDLFRICLEEASGYNLVEFFDQWIYNRGYPKLDLNYKYDLKTNTVTINIRQTQGTLNDQPTNWVKVFTMDLEVTIFDSRNTPHHVIFSWKNSTLSTRSIQLPNSTTPSRINVDPIGKLLFTLTVSDIPENILLDNLSSLDIYNRIWAFEELIKLGAKNPSLKTAVINESFWGVRVRSKLI